MKKTYKFKINGCISDKEFNNLSFGRQLEYRHGINQFKDGCKTNHLSVKRRSIASALKEFLDLYDVTEYYMEYTYVKGVWEDDSIQIWYK